MFVADTDRLQMAIGDEPDTGRRASYETKVWFQK
jgi:hypothetical protein